MPTLVLSPIMSPDSKRLRTAARELGWKTLRLEEWTAPEDLDTDETVVWGELKLGRVVAQAIPLALFGPTVGWTANLPPQLRKRETKVATIGEVTLSCGPQFIKPIFEKSFPSKVYDSGLWHSAVDELPDDLPVEISEPVAWDVEYRCFVHDRRIVTMSPYFRDGKPIGSPDAPWPTSGPEQSDIERFFAQAVNYDDLQMPPAVVIDIGHIANRGWAIVEANEAWASGIYGCDPQLVLGVLRHACVPASKVPPADGKWIHPFPLA